MSHFANHLRTSQPPPAVAMAREASRTACHLLGLVLGLAILAMPAKSFAESRSGSGGVRASIDFRIVIPAIIRVTPVSQPDRMVVEERHIAQGYIDVDAGSAVRLTVNTRDGYLLAARYDAALLSAVEVRVSNQSLTASSGFGSMRVTSGLSTDKLTPISYRLHLAAGIPPGDYHWPVALAFSLAST